MPLKKPLELESQMLYTRTRLVVRGTDLHEVRCTKCSKLLFRMSGRWQKSARIEIKCGKCGETMLV